MRESESVPIQNEHTYIAAICTDSVIRLKKNSQYLIGQEINSVKTVLQKERQDTRDLEVENGTRLTATDKLKHLGITMMSEQKKRATPEKDKLEHLSNS